MNHESTTVARHRYSAALLTFGVVAVSSLLFSMKGIMAKLAYREGADAITVLALRMGIALPVFLGTLWWTNRRAAHRLTLRDWGRLSFLGFIGYYFASLTDFMGLEHISAGLERIVLYTYPAFVVAGTALWFRRRPRASMAGAALIAWIGIAVTFAGEAQGGVTTRDLWLGTALVLSSAAAYAVFVIMSAEMVRRIGAMRFMSAVCSLSGVLMLVHWAGVKPVTSIATIPAGVWTQGVLLAVAGTLVPGFLTGIGLRLAGAQRFAIIGAIGPVATLVLAAVFLGETVSTAKLVGLALTMAGGLAASLLKDAGR
jgi:drug/metabolite transporter (DMT)-like permease